MALLAGSGHKKTTKTKIIETLTEQNSRKGVSLYAIKKHLHLKYGMDIEKYNSLINKTITAGVQDGTFIQVKGVGASGSFKLVSDKKKKKKKEVVLEEVKEVEEEEQEEQVIKKSKTKSKLESTGNKQSKKTSQNVPIIEAAKKKNTEKTKKKKEASKIEVKTSKIVPKSKKGSGTPSKAAPGTPAKKRSGAMLKRKSIGNILRPPKMRPK